MISRSENIKRHVIYWCGVILGKRFRKWYNSKTHRWMWNAVELGDILAEKGAS